MIKIIFFYWKLKKFNCVELFVSYLKYVVLILIYGIWGFYKNKIY